MSGNTSNFLFIEADGHVGVKDVITGEEIFPSCGADLKQYHAFLCASGKNGEDEAEALLESVIRGGAPLTDMKFQIEKAREEATLLRMRKCGWCG